MSLKSLLKKIFKKGDDIVDKTKEVVDDVNEAIKEKDISKVVEVISDVKDIKEDIDDMKDTVDSAVEDVREKYSLFVGVLEGFDHQTYTLCMALFLKQLITRTKDRVDLENPNLHYRIIASFKYVIKEVIDNYKSNIHIMGVDETVIVVNAIAYFTKLTLNKKAASDFRRDLLIIAKELKTEEDLNKYIASHKVTNV